MATMLVAGAVAGVAPHIPLWGRSGFTPGSTVAEGAVRVGWLTGSALITTKPLLSMGMVKNMSAMFR